MRENRSRAVELSVNTCEGDMGFFDATYRHVLGQLNGRPDSRRLVVDRSTPRGRFAAPQQGGRLDRVVGSLLAEGLIDAVAEVDWAESAVRTTMERTYADASAPARCSAGTPIYQYLTAIDACASPYLFHLDSDMLLHLEDGGGWIDEGIEHMQRHEDVVIVTPEGGPPQASSAWEWLYGHPGTRPPGRWHVSRGVSTRIFLMDVQRFRARALPLIPAERGETLERTITHTFVERGLARHSLNDDRNWSLHPRRHNENHIRHLDALIGLVEEEHVPFRRTGYRWDIRTEGRHFLPWWWAIQRDRVRRHR